MTAAMPYCALLMLGGMLARFETGDSGAAPVGPTHRAAILAPAVSFTISFATLEDVPRLDQRPEIAEVVRAARVYSDSLIFLSAYVTADDVRLDRVDAKAVADELVITMGGCLANRGIEADRISGKGMGINPAIGRAVVVSFGIAPAPSELGPRAVQVVHESLPKQLILGSEVHFHVAG